MSRELPRPRRLGSAARLSLALAAVLAAGACGGSPSPSPAPTPTPTPTASPGDSSGLRVPLPAGWQEVELTEEALQAQIDALAGTNPELAEPLRQLLEGGAFEAFIFYALGFEGLEPIGNVNAVTFPMPGLDIEAVTPLIEGQFAQIGATDIEIDQRTVLGTDGLVMAYRLPVTDAGGESATYSGRAYIAIVDGVAYNLTVTCIAADPAPCLADADTMAAGMTLGAS